MTERRSSSLVVVDCLDRYRSCGASCCTFDVPLSDEEVGSGRYQVAADPPGAAADQRKFLARGEHGLCVYWKDEAEACTVYTTRPSACRAFSCHADGRLWRDFEARRVNERAIRALRGRGNTPPRSSKT